LEESCAERRHGFDPAGAMVNLRSSQRKACGYMQLIADRFGVLIAINRKLEVIALQFANEG
jgi:hypothetical protein